MFRYLAFLIFLANSAFAEDGRRSLIEELSFDPPQVTAAELPQNEDQTGLGWQLYPPLESSVQWMELDQCRLTLFARDPDGTIFSRRDIDLSSSRIVPDTSTGNLYTWSVAQTYFQPTEPNTDDPPAAAGTIVFEALRDGAITLLNLDQPDPTPEVLAVTMYVMFRDPLESTVEDLSAALSRYQQDECVTLG